MFFPLFRNISKAEKIKCEQICILTLSILITQGLWALQPSSTGLVTLSAHLHQLHLALDHKS